MNNETEHLFLAASQKLGMAATASVNLENVEDFSTVCRICATVTEFVIPIFSGEGLQNKLADKIHKHLPIQVSEQDALPRVVCYQCTSTLLACHELAQCCQQADRALRSRLEQRGVTKEQFDKEQKPTSDSTQVYYLMVKNILVDYLNSINMDGENLDLIYVCQKCTEKVSSTNVAGLAEHLQATHSSEAEDSEAIEQFIKDNVTFEETLISDDSEREMESNKDTAEEVLPSFFCPFCDSAFSSSTRLVCHLNQHVEVCIENGVSCCGATYTSKKIFVTHLQEEHVCPDREAGDTATACRSCGHRALDAEDLQWHVRERHGDRTANDKRQKNCKEPSSKNQKFIPAVCPECNETFSNKYNMFVHMKSHSGEKKSFACEQCGKRYSQRTNLIHHRRLVHDGVLNHICSSCGEAFPTRRARDVHARLHSGDTPYTCPRCPKAFRAKNTLDRHIEMHLDVRKYPCHLCSKRFRKKTHLDYHLTTHRRKP